MRHVVQAGYEDGNYEAAFRADRNLNNFELRFMESLDGYMSSNARILDLGSGTGVPFDRHLVRKGYKVLGVDFAVRHLRSARRKVPEATYVKGDLSRIECAPESLDAVVSFYAIFHLPRREHAALFATIRRWLRPRGVVLMTLGTTDTEYGEDAEWCGAPMAWSSYPPEVYRQMLTETGFVIRVADFEGAPGDSEHHFWLLAQRA